MSEPEQFARQTVQPASRLHHRIQDAEVVQAGQGLTHRHHLAPPALLDQAVLAQEFRTFDNMSPWEGPDYVLPGDEKAKAQ